MERDSSIFADASVFEEYCVQLSHRLSAHREDRIGFLRQAVSRLEPLLRMAEGLQNAEVEDEVSRRLEAARLEIQSLENLSLDPSSPDSPC
jgi:hypothetical protein